MGVPNGVIIIATWENHILVTFPEHNIVWVLYLAIVPPILAQRD
jgi:hypothetical protein